MCHQSQAHAIGLMPVQICLMPVIVQYMYVMLCNSNIYWIDQVAYKLYHFALCVKCSRLKSRQTFLNEVLVSRTETNSANIRLFDRYAIFGYHRMYSNIQVIM